MFIYFFSHSAPACRYIHTDESGELFVKQMFFHVELQTVTGDFLIQAANRSAATEIPTVKECSSGRVLNELMKHMKGVVGKRASEWS